MASTTKQMHLLLSPTDEVALEEPLRSSIPSIAFIDGQIWSTATPPAREHLVECASGPVYLWDRSLYPILPCKPNADGRIRGPASGVVIQYVRGGICDGVLRSGDLGVGYDPEEQGMAEFVAKVWRVFQSYGRGTVKVVDPRTREILRAGVRDFIIGSEARAMARNGVLFKHHGAEVYYMMDE